jgi:hypothetical protein
MKQVFRRYWVALLAQLLISWNHLQAGLLKHIHVSSRIVLVGLTNYELFVDYQKLAMKMFGGFMNFTWNKVTKNLP